MALLMASAIGVLVGGGVYLMLRARSLSVLFGLTLVSYAVNLFLLASGRLQGAPPVLAEGTGPYSDPLPQALVLTAIVISFGMTAFLVVLALRAHIALRTDHVDGREPEPGTGPGTGPAPATPPAAPPASPSPIAADEATTAAAPSRRAR